MLAQGWCNMRANHTRNPLHPMGGTAGENHAGACVWPLLQFNVQTFQLQKFSYTNEHKIPMSVQKGMIKT
jgi:hypothetical protein